MQEKLLPLPNGLPPAKHHGIAVSYQICGPYSFTLASVPMSNILVQELIAKSAAVSPADGVPVAAAVRQAAAINGTINISLKGLRQITSAFLHVALGATLLECPQLNERLRVTDAENDVVLRKVNEVRKLATDAAYRAQRTESLQAELANC